MPFSGNLLHAFDQSWELSGVPILMGGQLKLSPEEKLDVKKNDKRNKAAIRT